jgi:hypothetical protein
MNNMKKKFISRKNSKSTLASKLISYILVAVIVFSVFFLYKDATYKHKEIFAGVELEQRSFVMSIIMLKDGIIFELANEEENDWQSSSEYVQLNTTDLKKAEKIYKANGEKVLDFSHMKIWFVESGSEKEEGKRYQESNVVDDNRCVENYRENIEYMYKEERFGENILVCELEGDIGKVTADAVREEKALAVKIENILKSSGKDKELELYKVYRGLTY